MKRLSLAVLLAAAAGCGAVNEPEVFSRVMPAQATVGTKDPGEPMLRVNWSEVPGASGYRVSISLTSSMEGARNYSFDEPGDAYVEQSQPEHQKHWITVAALVGNELSEPTVPLPVATSTSGGSLWVSAGLPAELDAQALPLWHPSFAWFQDATPAPPYLCRWSFGDFTNDVLLVPCTSDGVGTIGHVFPDYGYVWRVRLTVTAADGRTASSMMSVHTE